MKTPLIICFVIVSVIIGSCKKDDSTPTHPVITKASDYFMPLTTGNKTMLTGTTTLAIDVLPPKVTNDTTIFTILASTKTSTGGKLLRAVQTYSSGNGNDVGHLYAGDNEIIMFDSTLQEVNASTILKMPIQIGVPWRVTPNDTTLFVITSISETVTTGAGTFSNCLKISQHQSDTTGMNANIDYYIAKGVGIVRTKTDVKSKIGQLSMTVTSDLLLASKNF